MAYIFGLGVNCGDEDSAVEFCNYMRAAALRDGLSVRCTTSMEDGDWWAEALPVDSADEDFLWASGWPADAEDVVRISDFGKKLYELLKAGPDFRYAAVGFEASSLGKLAERLDMLRGDPASGFPGMVLSQQAFYDAGAPAGFKNFDRGYVWIPYEGERLPPTREAGMVR